MDLTANPSARTTAAIRLGVGLAQGLALYLLHHAQEAKAWPATEPLVFAPLVLTAAFAPFVLLAGAGALRRGPLILWGLVAAAFAAGLGYHGAWNGVDGDRMPDVPVFMAIAGGLFIAHHLVQPAHAHRRLIAPYEAYFDTTWMHGVQLALSAAFTGAFWILLFLGSALFSMIGIQAIAKLIANEAFSIPATTVMFAAAVQLTDVRASLVRGVRTVALTLLAWLLPLMTLIAAGFLASLPFTGLEPLWKTRAATALLLTAAAHLIVLINAAYQDGEEAPHLILKWAARIAGLLLIPIGLLAAYGLSLRIGQHGLTPERVFAAAFVLIALGHAAGYAVAAVRPGAWMKGLERTNVLMAFVSVALILALFTPLADPARLSVNDQVRRLESGKVKPEAFDFQFLRFDSGPYGKAALETLKASKTSDIARRARDAAKLPSRLAPAVDTGSAAIQNGRLLDKVVVYPKGAALPESFRRQYTTKSEGPIPFCGIEERCIALLKDVDDAGEPEILITGGGRIAVYRHRMPKDDWEEYGWFQLPGCRGKNAEALFSGGAIRSTPSYIRDLEIDGRRFHLSLEPLPCGFTEPGQSEPGAVNKAWIKP